MDDEFELNDERIVEQEKEKAVEQEKCLEQRFENFTPDDWRIWLRDFLARGVADPFLSSSRESRGVAVLRLYRGSLSALARDAFKKGLSELFETTEPLQPNADLICESLRLIAFLTPANTKKLLHRRVLSEIYYGLKSNRGISVHELAIASACEYSVTQELADYGFRSGLQEDTTIRYRIVAFRLLAAHDSRKAIDFFDLSNTGTLGLAEADLLAEELVLFGIEHGFRELYFWIKRNHELVLYPSANPRGELVKALRNRLVKEEGPALTKDPFLILFTAVLAASDNNWESSKIRAVASVGEYEKSESIWTLGLIYAAWMISVDDTPGIFSAPWTLESLDRFHVIRHGLSGESKEFLFIAQGETEPALIDPELGKKLLEAELQAEQLFDELTQSVQPMVN